MIPRLALCIASVSLAAALASMPSPPSTAMAAAAVVRFPSAPTPTKKAGAGFGETCKADGDCASQACSKGKQGAFCSTRCTRDADCATPPTAGACNGRGYCKRTESTRK